MASSTLKSKETVSDSESEDYASAAEEEYAPPAGFNKINSIKGLSKKALENKELWLVEIPSNIDVSKLKELPLPIPPTSLADGESTKKSSKASKKQKKDDLAENASLSLFEPTKHSTIAEIDGFEYTLESDSNHVFLNKNENGQPSLRVLVPTTGGKSGSDSSKKTDLLALSDKSFSRVITITPKVDIPEISYDKVIQPQPSVEQLTHMSLKHFATGYRGANIEEDKEDKEVKASTSSKKREHEEVDEQEKTEKKKSKKEKKDKKEKKKEKKRKE